VARKNEKFEDCVFIAGFHGFGGTGYIAVSYLINALSAKRVGFIQTGNMPPFTFMDNKRLVTPFEIYRRERLVFMKSEFSPHRTEESLFGDTLAKWIMRGGFKEAVLIGGLDASLKSDEKPALRVVPTKAYLPKARKLRIPLLESGLIVYGPIAIMMVNFEISDFPAAAVLPYADIAKPDFKAAGEAIRALCDMYSIEVNLSELELEALSLEEEMERRLAQVGKVWNGMYV